MGTPEFAVATLEALIASRHQVVGVVTAPDRPAGRGQQLRPSPVKQAALAHSLPLAQPEKLRDPAFLAQLTSWQPDLIVVVAFRMLPQAVWALPRLGTLNLHASLLPDYRGAAPINWAIIRGETRTGLTTFLIDHQIDTGDLLLQTELEISPNQTAGELHDQMMVAGAALVVQTADGLADQTLRPQPQNPRLARNTAPKIHKDDCRIDWHQPAAQVRNLIRGLSPYPAAWTLLDGEICKIYAAELGDGVGSPAWPAESPASGTAHLAGDALWVATTDGWLRVTELQPQGRKRMTAADFLRGYRGDGPVVA
jgi:methionyl-tRNA formyltransferase